jgi:hypothetical protein
MGVKKAGNKGRERPRKRRTLRLSVVINSDVVERAKNAVYWTPGLTLASLTEQALFDALRKLERRRGEPFEQREAELRAGRPLK